MRIENKKQIDDIVLTTQETTYVYDSTEWECIECDKNFIYINFVEQHPKKYIIYNKDQVVSIEIG